MVDINIKLAEKDLEKIIDRMPLKFKIRLVEKLERETRTKRWQKLFQNIDARFKKNPITQETINKEITAVRKRHAQGRP